MSFSSKVKNELARIGVKRNCCQLAELAALVHLNGTIQINTPGKVNIRISTENAATARRIFSLLKKRYHIQTEVMVRKNRRLRKRYSYMLVIPHGMGSLEILRDLGILKGEPGKGLEMVTRIQPELVQNECCKRAFLRGAFLGAGSVSDPEKTYHLEFVAHHEDFAEDLCNLLNFFELNAKIVLRKGNYMVYLKEGEHIVELFSLIGAHSALLDLENVRIYKDVRNNVNRIVNCETANLEKIVNASYRQIENIKYIRDHMGFHKLPPALRDIAELRLNYTEASLRELGAMLSPAIGKSGVNHRLRKLDKIAHDLKVKKGEI